MDLETYKKQNASFDKNIVYNFGQVAGFFSEFNNMIFAMLYCLQHQIKFSIYSANAQFKLQHGWTDFFLPFCDERHGYLNQYLNFRAIKPTNLVRDKICVPLFKSINNTDFLTQDIWPIIRGKKFQNASFSIGDRVGLNLQQASQILISTIWNLKAETKDLVENELKKINCPKNYIGIHIRNGDKATEVGLSPVSSYMAKIKANCQIKDIFLATDNYDVFKEAVATYPGYRFHTLCTPDHNGYIQADFQRLARDQKRTDMIRLFADIHILANAEHFIGTCTSNIGMFLGMKMDPDRVTFADVDHWSVF